MIDEFRIKHIMAVARLMEANAEKWGLDPQEMFTLGYLHDVGYEFGGSEEHHINGAEVLARQGYKYAQEILCHGKPDVGFESLALDLLNFADMHINKKGEYVSYADRLEDIATRRGKDSPHYQNCKVVIDRLLEKGFEDSPMNAGSFEK